MILHALLRRWICWIPRLWELYNLVFFALFLDVRFSHFASTLLRHFPFLARWIRPIRRLIISEQMRRVSLFFLCYFSVIEQKSDQLKLDLFFKISSFLKSDVSLPFHCVLSFLSRFSAPEILGFLRFSVSFFLCSKLFQPAIGQANRRRAERLKLSANRHE